MSSIQATGSWNCTYFHPGSLHPVSILQSRGWLVSREWDPLDDVISFYLQSLSSTLVSSSFVITIQRLGNAVLACLECVVCIGAVGRRCSSSSFVVGSVGCAFDIGPDVRDRSRFIFPGCLSFKIGTQSKSVT
jgi:hypothetical protein